MRETRPSGSEGGGAYALPTPIRSKGPREKLKVTLYPLNRVRSGASVLS
jgi:hypothetical protein